MVREKNISVHSTQMMETLLMEMVALPHVLSMLVTSAVALTLMSVLFVEMVHMMELRLVVCM